ncbi:hypothetical protein ACQ33O_08445 [Ferruginibacter sp. SUN002]|uniref:hypothetical protein n=1 Tax=Ferruginibacter sp. SUN002 TaxID=2937789 RepID=UPI003D36E1DF
MKTLSLCAVLLFSIFNTQFSFAQKGPLTTANIKVWGNCESCKKRIEGAALKAGAATAVWDEESKNLAVAFDAAKTSNDKIEKAIAAKGHDTQNFSAENAAYNKLPGCCKYDRKDAAATSTDSEKCCSHDKCAAHDKASCKEAKCCEGMDCCKGDGGCEKHDHNKAGASNDSKMKCGSEKSCCKKAKA